MEITYWPIYAFLQPNTLVESVGGLRANDDSLWRCSSFLEENSDLVPATRQKLLTILQDTQKGLNLQLELAPVIDAGEPFVKATYKLEGDGPLVFKYIDVLATLAAGIRTAYFPTLTAVSARLSAGNSTLTQQLLVQYGRTCMQPGLQYFLTQFTKDLIDSVAAFKVARLCVPQNGMHSVTVILTRR